MNEAKSSISQGKSYLEIGEYWDNHDLSDVWEQTEPSELTVTGHAQSTHYPVDGTLSQRLHTVARRRGVSAQALVNLWLQEKMADEAA